MQLEQLRKSSRLSDRVYAIVKRAILAGDLAPGQHLALEEIAQTLGVSTTPLRDALSLLAADGLVEWRPRRGAFVAHLTPTLVRETFQVREILEAGALELAIACGCTIADEMRELAVQIAAAGRDPAARSERAYSFLEVRFHTLPLECVGNAKLLEIYHGLGSVMTIAFCLYPIEPERNEEVLAEHQAIVAAIAAKDAAAARAAVATHLRNAQAALLARLGDGQPA